MCVFACVCDCWVLTLLVLSNEGLHAESVQINVIIPQLLLIRVINAQCKAGNAFSPSLHQPISPLLSSFWNGFEGAEAFGKGPLLATLQSRFSSAHNSLSKGRGGGKENP